MKMLRAFEKQMFAGFLALFFPVILLAQGAEAPVSDPPTVAPPLVREGDFAVDLEQALGIGASGNEIEAETNLGKLGIGPKNGWIADYPVTPDIIGEIRESVANAVDSGKLALSKEDALARVDNVNVKLGLAVMPYSGDTTYAQAPPTAENHPDPAVVYNYYYTQGPPVVTYYTPPPDYYYLYTWVPYPFFATGVFFSGFFVLHDFHRHVFVRGKSVFVSNHFRDSRAHRVFRVDPGHRFRGRTFAGIGAPRKRGFVSTGVRRSDRDVFNAPRARPAPGTAFRTSPRGTGGHGGGFSHGQGSFRGGGGHGGFRGGGGHGGSGHGGGGRR